MATSIDNEQHRIENCSYPDLCVTCPNCLVVSLDGSGHIRPPCNFSGDKTNLRTGIYAQIPLPVWNLMIENPDDIIHVFDKTTGRFEIVKDNAIFHAHSLDGVFEIKKNAMNKHIISFDSTTFKRFSVALAFFSEGAWRLRFRIVTTAKDGVLAFPLFRTFENRNDVYEIPQDVNKNTAMIFGIKTTSLQSTATLQVFAKTLASMNNDNVSGYFGQVEWDSLYDDMKITDTLKVDGYGMRLRFEPELYSLAGQQVSPDIPLNSWCSQCLPALIDTGTDKDFQTDIYGQVALPLFNLSFKNNNDIIHVFDKTTGRFEIVNQQTILHAHAVRGVFEIKKKEKNENFSHVIGFSATSLKRFSVVVAFFTSDTWRFGYRIVITLRNGIRVIPISNHPLENRNGSYQFPDGFHFNTALILGIKLSEATSIAHLQVFANNNGFLTTGNDNDKENGLIGYFGALQWDANAEKITRIDDTLEMDDNQLRFHHKLYRILLPLESHVTDEEYIQREYKEENEDEGISQNESADENEDEGISQSESADETDH